jgi:uncharacterized damage-inducible protein DinB
MTASQELSDRLRTEGLKHVEFLQAVPAEAWDQQLYSDGAGWSMRDLLTHIVEVEDSIPRLIRRVVNEGIGVAEDFDLDAYNERKVKEAQERDIDTLIALFSTRRAQTVQMTADFSEDDLQKEGRHPFLGETQVVEMIRLMILHVQLHLRDMRHLIKSNEKA